MDVKCKLLELNGKIDGDQTDVRRQAQRDRRKVQDSANASCDEGVGDRLRGLGRYGDDRKFSLGRGDDFRNLAWRVDFQPFHGLTDFLRIGVKEGDEFEPLLREPAIPQEGASEITDADHDGVPGAINPQAMSQCGDKFLGIVTDAGLTETAEIGKVFADLSVVDAERFAKLPAGDDL